MTKKKMMKRMKMKRMIMNMKESLKQRDKKMNLMKEAEWEVGEMTMKILWE
jgi:hypothetical protein